MQRTLLTPLIAALVLAMTAECPAQGSGTKRNYGRGSTTRRRSTEAKPALALGGKCPVCLVELGKEVPGKVWLSATYKGYRYLFPSQKQLSMFKKNPSRYAVSDGGLCPVCKVDARKKVKGKPGIFAVYQGHIYLFPSEDIKKRFLANPSRYAGSGSQTKPRGSAAK